MLPEVSTEAMSVFLERFAAERGPDEHTVLVLDPAEWHGARALRPRQRHPGPAAALLARVEPGRARLLYLRDRFLSYWLLDNYDIIVDARCAARDRLTRSACASYAISLASNGVDF